MSNSVRVIGVAVLPPCRVIATPPCPLVVPGELWLLPCPLTAPRFDAMVSTAPDRAGLEHGRPTQQPHSASPSLFCRLQLSVRSFAGRVGVGGECELTSQSGVVGCVVVCPLLALWITGLTTGFWESCNAICHDPHPERHHLPLHQGLAALRPRAISLPYLLTIDRAFHNGRQDG